jgi:hypothetical protein
LAQPAKAAANRKKEELRELMRLKALLEQVPVSFKCGPRELMQVATAMQEAMEELNDKSQIVLQACRQSTWLAYRPVGGRLVPASQQPWARALPMGSSRLNPCQVEQRLSWLSPEGKPLPPSKASEVPALEPSYFEKLPGRQEDFNLDFDAVQLVPEEEVEAVQQLQLHPSERTVKLQSSLEALTSQAKRQSKDKIFGRWKKKLWKQGARQRWRKAMAGMTPEEAAAAVVVSVGVEKVKNSKASKKKKA